MRPRLAVTAGEPAGIGPDLCVHLQGHPFPADVVIVADPELLRERARVLKMPLVMSPWCPGQPFPAPDVLAVWPVSTVVSRAHGILTSQNAAYVLETITMAAKACLRGDFEAMVTGPISKASVNDAGYVFSGHTEFLAEITGGDPVMLLTAPGLRVALATTHLPLRAVPEAITRESLARTLRILHHDLRDRFGISSPRILVAGLNPHAGEGGHLGHEEAATIIPVLDDLRSQGMQLIGPLPADTLFVPEVLKGADAVLAMYHDQGLPVLKSQSFGQAVNITLGLPIIRTSVDHGTALDRAGTGAIDTGSLFAAMDAAITMSTLKSRGGSSH
ncbi:MAG: 4-hydroxythreonine-4-phosphate dehydrogenase PdxA [Methylococcus sp.]|nr:MAG: 4-hydroxythreonine-4-phosphate dehydrogenase PdxA [Methylococcus sp.]